MSISEIKIGSIIRVKVGRNIILAKVVEILDGAVRVCSVANNREPLSIHFRDSVRLLTDKNRRMRFFVTIK